MLAQGRDELSIHLTRNDEENYGEAKVAPENHIGLAAGEPVDEARVVLALLWVCKCEVACHVKTLMVWWNRRMPRNWTYFRIETRLRKNRVLTGLGGCPSSESLI